MWGGDMNWPVESDWQCEVCSADRWWLEWGIVNGHCRCSQCHAQYKMRVGDEILTRPRCWLKPEYIEPAKAIWRDDKIPVDQISWARWNRYLKKTT